MEWFKRHVDTVIVLGGILSAMVWVNGKFSDIDKRFGEIEKRLIRIETVLVMHRMMPAELAHDHPKDE